ncbi:transcription factor ILR3-like [Phragmites australis]|uniref:transcription factor ILR3-like n=1 Tax=Phragmites australis TaxID=29695 RepID=UPI002D7777C4|nr:transcription factor ILR3-like [Phragmites australis]
MAMSCGGQDGGWLLDYGLMEEEIQGAEFMYMVDDPAVSSVILGFDAPRKEDGVQDNSGSKKRSRPESSAPPGTKACREKLRRDRLNERFNELCAILEPGNPPKADKVAILSDAARLLGQLRAEAQKLRISNESLQESIKSLKAEKSELRDEKTRLKAERERLEQMLKGVSAAAAPVPFVPHPSAATVAPSFHPAAFAQTGKYVPYASYPPPAAFWQWIPPTSLDTSKDPVHWPPVA